MAVKKMSASELRKVAHAADCDPRSVAHEIAEPGKVNNNVRERVRRAMRDLKLGPYRERE